LPLPQSAPDNARMKVGQIIRKARLERGITLEALALAAGTDAANLSRIERGKQGFSPDMIDRIAQALDLPLSILYQRVEQEAAAEYRVAPPTNQDDPVEPFRKWLARLNPENCALALEFIKLLARRQRNTAAGGGDTP
jgi:transcriptional regulator with XRE-family HTH domain